MNPTQNRILLVARDDLRTCEVRDVTIPAPSHGEALLRIETFGLSSNNITYLALGDAMPYRDIFPVPDEVAASDWCSAPVWGVAGVVDSNTPMLKRGDRVYGLFPASRYHIVAPTEATPGGFRVDRPQVPAQFAFYHQYGVLGRDPFFLAGQEELMVLMRPLFLTGLLLDDYLRENNFAGAGRVVVSSAASKTAFGFASAFRRAGGADLVGLASVASRDAALGFDLYDRVVVYEEIEALDAGDPVAYVDISGSIAIRKRMTNHLGDQLKFILSVGLTHWADGAYGSNTGGDGARSEVFFAPGWFAERVKQQGQPFIGGLLSGWKEQVNSAESQFAIVRETGPDAVMASFISLVEGRADPNRALVHDL